MHFPFPFMGPDVVRYWTPLPYHEGQLLKLKVTEDCAPKELRLPEKITAEVVQLVRSKPSCCCMILRINAGGRPITAFLKLYQNHFDESQENPRTRMLNTPPEDDSCTESSRQTPNLCHRTPHDMLPKETPFDRETTAYRMLKPIQGSYVPTHLANIELVSISMRDREDVAREPRVKGILLEYVKGFPLSLILHHARPHFWMAIFGQIIDIIDAMADLGIASSDQDPSKYIVVHYGRDEFKVVRIGIVGAIYCILSEEAELPKLKLISEKERQFIGDQLRQLLDFV